MGTFLIIVLVIVVAMNWSRQEEGLPKKWEPGFKPPLPLFEAPPAEALQKDQKTLAREAFLESQISKSRQRRKDLGIPHLAHRGSYMDYIQSRHWRAMSKQAKRALKGKCEFCGQAANHAHHVYYPEDQANLGLEDIASLCIVCAKCHEVLHGKKMFAWDTKCTLCRSNECTDWLPVRINHYDQSVQRVCENCKCIAMGFRDEAYGWSANKYLAWIDNWQESFLARRNL